MGHAIAMSDAELLEASRRGEHAAFGRLVERYQQVVCAVSYSRTRDHALSQDVAQETFLAAWRQLDQLREASRLRSWLCGIARNLASKARKRTARETALDEPQLAEADARGNPFDAVSAAQAEHLVGEALGRVPETYRDVMVLYYREQRSVGEVARMLGISEAAALQRLARGRRYLADGVASLVERSLRALPRTSLVASVVAALPLIAPSRAEAQPTHGGNMFKLAIASAVLVAAGTTAYVVHARTPSATPSKAVAAAPATAPTPTATPDPSGGRSAPRPPALAPAAAAAPGAAPAVEATPVISNEQIAKLGLAEGASRGPADAPVVITVFTDMQCTYCASALGSLDQLFDDYPNKLRVVVKQMPVHETAKLAAEAAFAADAQGKFWELHDLMLANQDSLSRDGLLELGKQAGLDVARLRTALDTHEYADELARDVAAAREIEIQATPSFLINGRKIVGNLPVKVLRETIDAALAEAS